MVSNVNKWGAMRCCQDFAYVFFSLRVLTWEVATSSLRTFHSRTIVRITTVTGGESFSRLMSSYWSKFKTLPIRSGQEVNKESFSVIPRFFFSLRLLDALRTRAQQGDSQNRIPPWENKPLYSKGHQKKTWDVATYVWKRRREKTQREFLHKIIEAVSDWVSRLSIQQFGVHSVSCRILVHKRDCFWRARRNHLMEGGRAKWTKKLRYSQLCC